MSRAARAPSPRIVSIALLAIFAAMPADAQVWGRRGASWQPEMRREREKLAEFEASLERLTREQWRKQAVAWLEVERPADDRMLVTESEGVQGLKVKKKVRVRALDTDEESPSAWEVVFEKKPPRKLVVVMTAGQGKRETCSLGTVLPGGGALGIFQHRGAFVCVAREPEPEGDRPSR